MAKYVKVRGAIRCDECASIGFIDGLDKFYAQYWTLRKLTQGVTKCRCSLPEVAKERLHFVGNLPGKGLFVDLSPHALDGDEELSISVAEALGEGAG